MTRSRPFVLSCFICTPMIRVQAPAHAARRWPVQACAASRRGAGYLEAADFAKAGDFHGAARMLRTADDIPVDNEARRAAVRALLNPISLDKFTATDDNGVIELYKAMKDRHLLRAFGSVPLAMSSPSATDKAVSVERLVSQAGIPLSALAPKKETLLFWRIAGIAAVVSVVAGLRSIGEQSLASPVLLSLGGLFFFDQNVLRGLIFEQIYGRLFPQFYERIARHEAGHLLCGYLSGLSISGYVLSGQEALKGGVPGQAGTLFFDARMSKELQSGVVTNQTIDRYSCVLMAGIAAEAIQFGQAEGGAGDETAMIALLSQLTPAWSPTAIKAQARWAVLQAILMLRSNKKAYEALYEAMNARKPLGECIDVIEQLAYVPSPEEQSRVALIHETENDEHKHLREAELRKREEQVLAELNRVRERLIELEGRGGEFT